MIYLLLITVKSTVYLLITRDKCFNKLISILFVIQKSLYLLLPRMLTFVYQASVKRFRHFAPPHPPSICWNKLWLVGFVCYLQNMSNGPDILTDIHSTWIMVNKPVWFQRHSKVLSLIIRMPSQDFCRVTLESLSTGTFLHVGGLFSASGLDRERHFWREFLI